MSVVAFTFFSSLLLWLRLRRRLLEPSAERCARKHEFAPSNVLFSVFRCSRARCVSVCRCVRAHQDQSFQRFFSPCYTLCLLSRSSNENGVISYIGPPSNISTHLSAINAAMAMGKCTLALHTQPSAATATTTAAVATAKATDTWDRCCAQSAHASTRRGSETFSTIFSRFSLALSPVTCFDKMPGEKSK